MMESLTISWEYLTGYATATDPSTRDGVEWPPHPARVFMALAAAWFETEPLDDSDEERSAWHAERQALRWLETLGDPELHLPDVDPRTARQPVTVYVPVNDRAGPAAAMLQSAPSIPRNKQPRTFPKIWVGPNACCLHWPDAVGASTHTGPLDLLCRKVTRIGHSSSLVAMRAASDENAPNAETCLVRDDLQAERSVRSVSDGMLDMLEERFGESPRRRHAALSAEVDELNARRKTIRGKGAAEAKGEIDARLTTLKEELAKVDPRPPVRPSTGLWAGYRKQSPGSEAEAVWKSPFDQDFFVLTPVDGQPLPVESTLQVTRVLRETIQNLCPDPIPSWVSGHAPDGSPLRDGGGHIAVVPLPHVGPPHADGHLLGLAIVFPRSIPPNERGSVLRSLLIGDDGQLRPVSLRLGRLGVRDFKKLEPKETARGLNPATWTAVWSRERMGTRCWASATPVVLDRFPKAQRIDPAQRIAWETEVRSILLQACERAGLPQPSAIDVNTTSWHIGSPRAYCKRRPFRGGAGTDSPTDVPFGDGFPPYPAKGTNAPRPQIHVFLEFPVPVVGPVLLGAGRFLGYGLFKPWREADHG
ncbi:type I-G CRISPR-associated protein Csb2 [Aquisphaera insulae]|uniref:type I-G CRISPR-associated protein Csb2 n=1 Tax=Aquisphaera insulae TaxID=2712864 RepID=UPI0013EA88C3|nr:type I-U CRISPR-associated protein Csb2 [Aquisphaera insulae]